MSEPASPPVSPPPNYTGGQIAMMVFGIIFLLPGLCSLGFIIGMAPEINRNSLNDPISQMIFTLWGVCFAVSAVGIAMIVMARKRARVPR